MGIECTGRGAHDFTPKRPTARFVSAFLDWVSASPLQIVRRWRLGRAATVRCASSVWLGVRARGEVVFRAAAMAGMVLGTNPSRLKTRSVAPEQTALTAFDDVGAGGLLVFRPVTLGRVRCAGN